jgi:hypothetical protein
VRYAASFFAWFAGEAPRIYGETIPATRADQQIVVERVPVGVCALVTPWNFPAAMLARKLAPALAAGCTAVAKPSELTPLTTLALAALAADRRRAGRRDQRGDRGRAAGAERLIADPRVRKVSFTGSTAVGRAVLARARRAARGCRSSWAATRRSWCWPTPTSSARWPRRWSPSSQRRPDLRRGQPLRRRARDRAGLHGGAVRGWRPGCGSVPAPSPASTSVR